MRYINFQIQQSSLTASLRSRPRSPFEVCSPFSDFSPVDEVVKKEFFNGSVFFRINGFLVKLEGLKFPEYFHDPRAPLCFHSSYDLRARTQLTILADFPP